MNNQRPFLLILMLFLCLPLFALIALSLGRLNFSLATVIKTFTNPGANPLATNVVQNLRFPRVLAALFIGAALSSAGMAYQKTFANPLVSPDLLGVTNGASVGAAMAILCGGGVWLTQGAAFLGGIIAVGLALLIPQLLHQQGNLILILAGVVVSGFMQAALGLLKYLADPDSQLQSIVYWQLGSIAKIDRPSLLAIFPILVVGFLILLAYRWHLTVMGTGEATTQAVGINQTFEQVIIVIGATLLTASAVSLSGTIGWIGLVIPHVARLLVGDDARFSLPLSAILGGIFLLVIDTLARTLSAGEIPLSILTGFIGTPVFILILATSHRRKSL
ncbi:iron ABC transporter permease [Lactobacillus alvi]|uniref:Iron ABC transporter permease n=1 Tax=Limosilactobacillus alvi TaxID=990412 RepID=A0ABS2EPS1_9LACO|nr:iron ABC transporter permease [Limosilactobacillus alvi]MBM6754413.1 iron ABC transporter permease [Limosilactobacillus alvi]